MTDWRIRDATPEDVEAVLDLWRRADATESSTDSPEYLAQLVRGWPGALVLAVDAKRVVGSVIAGFDGWRGKVYRLAVNPDYRRRGVGRALLREAEARLRAQGARRVHANVESDHPLAVAFWQSTSYAHVPRIHIYSGNLE